MYIDFTHQYKHGEKTVNRKHTNAHLVGISRVSDHSNLKILGGFDPDLVLINQESANEIDRLRKCTMPMIIPNLQKVDGFKVVFYNLQGLKTHLEDIKHDSNLMSADVILGAETNLKCNDQSEVYNVIDSDGKFSSYRFDEENQVLGRGLIAFSKLSMSIVKTVRKEIGKDALELLNFELDVKGHLLLLFNIYSSPKFPTSKLKQELTRIAEKYESFPNVLIMGDFNTQSDLMEENGFSQVICDNTTAGVSGGKLCHAYVR